MISHEHKCVFVHQRKNAGSSIRAFLSNNDQRLNNTELDEGLLDVNWDDASIYNKDYFKFCVIRNPWDRFISGWKFCRTTRGRSIIDVLNNLPEKDYLHNIFRKKASLGSRSVYTLDLIRLWYLKLTYLCNARQKIRTMIHNYSHITQEQYISIVNSEGKLVVDKIFYFEELEKAFGFLSKKLNIELTNIPRINVRRDGEDYRNYFNDQALELFAEKFENDIKIWGYEFEHGPGIAPTVPPRTHLLLE